jgi:hypothetical protein
MSLVAPANRGECTALPQLREQDIQQTVPGYRVLGRRSGGLGLVEQGGDAQA